MSEKKMSGFAETDFTLTVNPAPLDHPAGKGWVFEAWNGEKSIGIDWMNFHPGETSTQLTERLRKWGTQIFAKNDDYNEYIFGLLYDTKVPLIEPPVEEEPAV